MQLLTHEALHAVCPKTSVGRLALFIEPINQAFEERDISTSMRQAMFLAQYAHETDGFTKLEENLHYRDADRVRAMFKRHLIDVTDEDVAGYLESPEIFASRIYADRNGNGPEASGDGWRYRGRGLPHLTFRGNYERFAQACGTDVVEQPDLVAQPDLGAQAGGWFWQHEKCNDFADRGDFEGLTKRINGGLNGFAYRTAYLAAARKALG